MQRKKIEKEKKPVILKINLAFNVWDIFEASNTSINVDHKANTGMSKYASNWLARPPDQSVVFQFYLSITQQRGPVALDVVYVQKLPFKFQLITFSICLVKSQKNTSRSLFCFWETLAANNNIIHYYKYKVIDVLSP